MAPTVIRHEIEGLSSLEIFTENYVTPRISFRVDITLWESKKYSTRIYDGRNLRLVVPRLSLYEPYYYIYLEMLISFHTLF
jgi:hypothetical protein